MYNSSFHKVVNFYAQGFSFFYFGLYIPILPTAIVALTDIFKPCLIKQHIASKFPIGLRQEETVL
jgi:hypothetical protein